MPNVLNDTHLLGLSCEFQGFTAVPWNEARLCGLLKETPTALFQDAELIENLLSDHDYQLALEASRDWCLNRLPLHYVLFSLKKRDHEHRSKKQLPVRAIFDS